MSESDSRSRTRVIVIMAVMFLLMLLPLFLFDRDDQVPGRMSSMVVPDVIPETQESLLPPVRTNSPRSEPTNVVTSLHRRTHIAGPAHSSPGEHRVAIVRVRDILGDEFGFEEVATLQAAVATVARRRGLNLVLSDESVSLQLTPVVLTSSMPDISTDVRRQYLALIGADQ